MYLPLAIIGYIFNASAILMDKFLVEKSIPNPIVYTFYLGLLSGAALLLIPFGFFFPNYTTLVMAFLSSFSLMVAWLIFFRSLRLDEASKVAPIVGTFNPIFTLLIGYFFFNQFLNSIQLAAVMVLILGMAILSFSKHFIKYIISKQIQAMVFAGFMFALSSVFLREVFLQTSFINGLIWSRIFIAALVLTFLLGPKLRQQIFDARITKSHFLNKTSLLLLLGQAAGAVGGLLLTYSISLTSPAIINALQGVQYIFILIVVLLLSKKYQHLLDEQITKGVIFQKGLGSLIIALGLALLAIG